MTFKGGTSLSKAYGLIDRFSEDIDVAIKPGFFIAQGFDDPEEPGLSKPQRDRRRRALDVACAGYIGDPLLAELQTQFSTRLASTDGWSIDVDPTDSNALLFQYRQSNPQLDYSSVLGGVKIGIVKIELGWRAKTDPQEPRTIVPFLAEIPMLLRSPQVICNVLAPGRTFWEKVTALHAESFRGETKRFFSRHYSDVAAMLQTQIGKTASRDLAMLDDVRIFKDVYYHSGWARYDLARPGSLAIVPSREKLRDLAGDYRGMRQMFLSHPPSFDWVIDQLRAFESEVNAA